LIFIRIPLGSVTEKPVQYGKNAPLPGSLSLGMTSLSKLIQIQDYSSHKTPFDAVPELSLGNSSSAFHSLDSSSAFPIHQNNWMSGTLSLDSTLFPSITFSQMNNMINQVNFNLPFPTALAVESRNVGSVNDVHFVSNGKVLFPSSVFDC
jgi:hypothetical protein